MNSLVPALLSTMTATTMIWELEISWCHHVSFRRLQFSACITDLPYLDSFLNCWSDRLLIDVMSNGIHPYVSGHMSSPFGLGHWDICRDDPEDSNPTLLHENFSLPSADEMLDQMMLHAYDTCIRGMGKLRVAMDVPRFRCFADILRFCSIRGSKNLLVPRFCLRSVTP
jgi:hypothetical protein